MAAVDQVVDEALAQIDPDIRKLIAQGDAAWSARPRAVEDANRSYYHAAAKLDELILSPTPTNAPALRVCFSVTMARLSWTYVVNKEYAAADRPYKDALDAITPLFESAPARYAPLRSWLLAERAYMECMEDRFGEALGDLREAGILWTGHVPVDGAYEAQVLILQASMGGMCRKVGDRSAALEMTTRAIVALEELAAGAEGDSVGGRARPAGAPPGGAGLGLPPSFVNLLAGCHYRRAELLHDLGSRLESLQSYRRALDVWRGQFRRAGEPYRLTYAQVLGRVANASVDLKEYAEAIAAWEEMRETLRPLVESDPEQYGPVDAGIRDNIATAHRDLGDESRAAAAEAAAKDSATSP
jgi:tetratricopeptide (TPR) repeat protein